MIGQGIGKTPRIVDPFRQHFAHERLGVVHVLETEGLHRILEDAIVADEIFDRFHFLDVGEIVGAFAFDFGLARRALERRRKVRRDKPVADGGAEHLSLSWRSGSGTATHDELARSWRGLPGATDCRHLPPGAHLCRAATASRKALTTSWFVNQDISDEAQ